MGEEKKALFAAFKAKDTRFDGRFFVGISSTGIYCRPVCRARQPKLENCTFYHTAAEAEKAGYRPCLLCRPELAPGISLMDANASLASRAARILEENCANGLSLDKLAGKLGCSDRHLRRVFVDEYSVTPVQYLQTCRLLLAKNMLTDTNLSVLDIAMASGFGSLRRFNDLFKKHYRLTPSDLRKRMSKEKRNSDAITITTGYRPPYPWEDILNFLSFRAIPGVEKVEHGEYFRTVRLQGLGNNGPESASGENKARGSKSQEDRNQGSNNSESKNLGKAKQEGADVYGWIRVAHKPEKNVLALTVSENLVAFLPRVLVRVRHLFDLDCDPDAVYETLQVMNEIRPHLCVKGTRLPGSFDPFEVAIRAILGQQISVKAASTLAARLVEAYGTPLQTGIEGLTHAFPSYEDILALGDPIDDRLGPLGITSMRAKAILELAQAQQQGTVNFGATSDIEEEIKKLTSIYGIGNWTAQYLAMRAMGWPDAFLETDVGVRHALPGNSPKELLEMAEAWRPWRSYATINLWNSL